MLNHGARGMFKLSQVFADGIVSVDVSPTSDKSAHICASAWVDSFSCEGLRVQRLEVGLDERECEEITTQ